MPPSIKLLVVFLYLQHSGDCMKKITIKRARELLGDETYRLHDDIIQEKIDKMMVLANRTYDIIELSKKNEENNGKYTE
jgi:hypothetical protein